MKIGIVLWDMAQRGGTQRQVAELARHLKSMGDDVVVCAAYYDPSAYPDTLKGIPVRYLVKGHQKIRYGNVTFMGLSPYAIPFLYEEWRYSKRLQEIIPKDLDVLNAHDNAFVAAARWKLGTCMPTLWMMNEFPGAVVPSRHLRSPSWNFLLDLLSGKFLVRRWYDRSIRMMDRVVVLDNRNRNLLRDSVAIDPIVIRSGLDSGKFFCASREPYEGQRPFAILSTGIFFPHRRLEDIADAVRMLKGLGIDVIWQHVGSGDRYPEYTRNIRLRVEQGGISDVTRFLGKVSDEELVRLYGDSDVFIFPNSPQTWGLAVFEAMACGTPVIVSRGAGASEVLTDGLNGLMVDPCRPEQIASCVRKLATSPSLWENLSEKGKKFVEENIRWDLYASRMRAEMETLREG
jgi:glycosyltransferase involved in cell wall biosynthesis